MLTHSTNFLLSDLSEALENAPGDAKFATEQPERCDCNAHPWPHMKGVSLQCSRKNFAARQWEDRLSP